MDYSIDYVMRKIVFGVFLMCLPISLQAGVMYEERSEYENLSEESRFCLELVEPGVAVSYTHLTLPTICSV